MTKRNTLKEEDWDNLFQVYFKNTIKVIEKQAISALRSTKNFLTPFLQYSDSAIEWERFIDMINSIEVTDIVLEDLRIAISHLEILERIVQEITTRQRSRAVDEMDNISQVIRFYYSSDRMEFTYFRNRRNLRLLLWRPEMVSS